MWASLRNTPAWEDRAWYGIDQEQVAMGVRVDTEWKLTTDGEFVIKQVRPFLRL